MCVTVNQWQICDAVFSFMQIFRGLTTRKVVGLLRHGRECLQTAPAGAAGHWFAAALVREPLARTV